VLIIDITTKLRLTTI